MVAKKCAFLFPGQGSQYPLMALDFFEASGEVRTLFALASEVNGRDMRVFLAEADADALKRTEVAQSALTLANLAVCVFLAERGLRPLAAAGHSLGEYAALYAAGVLGAEDCLRLVKVRGEAMAVCCGSGGGMAAVLGLPPDKVEALLAEWRLEGVYAANFNSPRQTVISGEERALAEAEVRFKEAGARRVVRLAVAGAFHSPFMAPAAAAFAPALESAVWHEPACAFFSNVTGGLVSTGAEAKALAARQITSAVRWTAIEAGLAALPLDAVYETGPGAVLAGLWRDSGNALPCHTAGKVSEIIRLLAAA